MPFSPTDLIERKKELRRNLRALRRAIPHEQKCAMDEAMIEHLRQTATYRDAEMLWLYAPLSDEPDLFILAQKVWLDGKQVAFPISHTESHTLTFHTVTSLSELTSGAYGICEPPANAPRVTDTSTTLCVVPALSFDANGYRLGYGGGYYDRLLSKFHGKTVGLAYSFLLQTALPRGTYDRAVERIITEKGVLLPDEEVKKE